MKAGVRKVVYAATGGTIYGEPQRLPAKETQRAGQPSHSPYGISKKVVVDYLRLLPALPRRSTSRRSRSATCTGRARTRTERPA